MIELSVSSEELGRWNRQPEQAQTRTISWFVRIRNTLNRYSPLIPPTILLITLVVVLVQTRTNDADSSVDSNGLLLLKLEWSTQDNGSIHCANVTLLFCTEEFCKTEYVTDVETVAIQRSPTITTNDTGFFIDYTLDLRVGNDTLSSLCNVSDGFPLESTLYARKIGILNLHVVQAFHHQPTEMEYYNSSASSFANASSVLLEISASEEFDVVVVVNNSLITNSKARFVVFMINNDLHSALSSNGTACAYLRSGGNVSTYNTSVVSEPSLVISQDKSLLIFHIEDADDGMFNNSTTDGDDASNSSDSSTLDKLGRRILALESSRSRYKKALIIVLSVFGITSFLGAVLFIYQQRRKQQFIEEEMMLRNMRGDHDNELELMHTIYLLSSSSHSYEGSVEI
ncbi:uncharacterized protein PHALS_07952 [Plasmopara halstedii]|uniref:Transmembrane protein n=1 Tax=Plasmopara halstedii TaxID=4781 RepID=A0A0P1B8G7_PLAHL|nr:uncharacterized protein PHALS_07952 [Plasmopara halstedii]CEG50228.1 hypothetical protein PHALS_07952 [Plasmopara halstedii]|eukprot:XP_024586597.1 hypothetical protein PHALS_07952 [Plasmopara halstedii]